MSDETVDRTDRIEPEAEAEEDAVLAKPLADYLSCVERLKGIFPGKEHEDALEASIRGCVEVIARGGGSSSSVRTDTGAPPPPPLLPPQPTTEAAPRRVTKQIFTPAQRCWMARQHYDHIYHIWLELGKQQSGPLHDQLVAAWREVDHWCYAGPAPETQV